MERNPNPVEDKFIGFTVNHKFNDDWVSLQDNEK